MRGFLLLGIVLALGSGSADVAAQGPLRVAAPTLPCGVPSFLVAVTNQAHTPIAFETAPDDCWRRPPSTQSASLGFPTAEDALNWLVAADPRYVWQRLGSVLVVRPKAAWNDPAHFLHRAVSPFAATFSDLGPVMRAMSRAFFASRRFSGASDVVGVRHFMEGLAHPWGLPPLGYVWVPRPDPVPWGVDFPGGSLLDALNALVEGGTTNGWAVTYCRPIASDATAVLMVAVTDDVLGKMRTLTLFGTNDSADPCVHP